MRSALDVSPDSFNAYEKRLVADIREHGWFHTGVGAEGKYPEFSYTTGFWISAQIPEILVFSIDYKVVHDILWDMFRAAKSGIRHPVGSRIAASRISGILADYPVYLFPVAKRHYGDYPLSARWFYGGEDFPCLQLVWPDRDGVFPWQDNFDESFRQDQPDLTEHGWRNSLAQ